MNNFLNIL